VSLFFGFHQNEEIAVNMVIAGLGGASVIYYNPDGVSGIFYY
jgi:hypothetical protein